MWPYHPELLSTPVPRYTSFPTAAEFHEGIGAVEFAAALAQATGDVSLYVHVPFCESICWYCGCNTSAANRRERLASYLDALHREAALIGGSLPAGARVRRIAFGGGSPNAMTPVDFVRLVSVLTMHMPLDNPLISVELDPRTLSDPWGTAIGGVGAKHASLGVQTLAPALQEAIGRIQPLEMIEGATAMLRKAGVSSLNFDLMYGLPGQNRFDLEETLAHAVRLGADRIALFGYAHVPHLIPRQQRIDASALPDQAERFAMAALGFEQLTAAGYCAIGFDHFALPDDPLADAAREGRLHRNFQGFTDDDAPALIGLGVSAISCFPGLLTQNEKNAGRYRMLLSQDRLAASRGVARLEADRLRGTVIEQLLCHARAVVPAEIRHEAMLRLMPFIEAGLCAFDGNVLSICGDGLPYARSIAAQFDPYRQESLRRFSSAV